MSPPDPARLVAEHALYRLLADLAAAGHGESLRAEVRLGPLVAVLQLGRADQVPPRPPLAPPPGPRTECERDILAWFGGHVPPGERRTGEEVVRGLSKAGLLHGTSTVLGALTRLRKRGLLANGDDHRGYRPA